jgi:hypothetical protein
MSSTSAEDRLDRLEAAFDKLQAVLDDSLALIDRLRELEVKRRRASEG